MGFTGSWIFWERGWDSGSVVFPCPWSGACDSSRGGRAHRPSLEREGSSLTCFGWTFDSYQDCLGKANGSQPRAGIWLYRPVHHLPVPGWHLVPSIHSSLAYSHSHSSSRTPKDSSIYPFYLMSLQGSHICLPSCPSVSMHSHAPSLLSSHLSSYISFRLPIHQPHFLPTTLPYNFSSIYS